jgi:hypothetical protein
VEPSGKSRWIYSRRDTPFEIFRHLPDCESYLRSGVTLAELEQTAKLQSDNEVPSRGRASCTGPFLHPKPRSDNGLCGFKFIIER